MLRRTRKKLWVSQVFEAGCQSDLLPDAGRMLVGCWPDAGRCWSDAGRMLVGCWSDAGRMRSDAGRMLVGCRSDKLVGCWSHIIVPLKPMEPEETVNMWNIIYHKILKLSTHNYGCLTPSIKDKVIQDWLKVLCLEKSIAERNKIRGNSSRYKKSPNQHSWSDLMTVVALKKNIDLMWIVLLA